MIGQLPDVVRQTVLTPLRVDTVRMKTPKFMAPYRMRGKRGKSDAADVAAICEADTV